VSTPVAFRLGHFMIRHQIRGGHRLLALMQPHWSDRTADYKLSSGLDFTVPIGRPDSCWDLQDVLEYEFKLVTTFCEALRPLSDVTLFDCGADIGLFSASVCVRSTNISRVVAFEPNQTVQDVLGRNVSRLPHGKVIPAAVADFIGFGQLMAPDYDPKSDHARYLAKAESGLPVTTIDSLGVRGGNIAIKIDVEGGELAAFRGASETIRSAHTTVVAFESNRDVEARTGVDSRECMKLLAELALFHFTLAETGEPLDPQSRISSHDKITNIVGIATAKHSPSPEPNHN
jgi:FkbM family methyltransferase